MYEINVISLMLGKARQVYLYSPFHTTRQPNVLNKSKKKDAPCIQIEVTKGIIEASR